MTECRYLDFFTFMMVFPKAPIDKIPIAIHVFYEPFRYSGVTVDSKDFNDFIQANDPFAYDNFLIPLNRVDWIISFWLHKNWEKTK